MVSFCKSKYRWLMLLFLTIVAIFSYMSSYRYIKNKYDKSVTPKTFSTDNIKMSRNKEITNNDNIINKEETSEVVLNKQEKIKKSTSFIIITLDKHKKTSNRESSKVPISFIGLNREQLEKYYEYYMNNLPVYEMEQGLLNVRVSEFSDKEVVINKTYDASSVVYYITEKDGYVQVFYADKKTLYENTQIKLEELPNIEQKNIKAGLFVKDKDELIGILEGYSS